MSKDNLIDVLQSISSSKKISKDYIFKSLEQAFIAAYKKKFHTAENAVTIIDKENGTVNLFSEKEVVEEVDLPTFEISLKDAKKIDKDAEIGNKILVKIEPTALGRIPTMTAMQVFKQKIKDQEKDNLYAEFKVQEGELKNGFFQREIKRTIMVDLGPVEGLLPISETSPRDKFTTGARIKVLIKKVERGKKAPFIYLTRRSPLFVKKLFEIEVPEIYDKSISVINIAREAGYKTKMIVKSNKSNIDPVGACLGMKGIRIQAVVRELEGEKIDLIEYSDDPKEMIEKALSPAKIKKVIISEEQHAKIVVEDDQFSYAIGKGGKNVKLAVQLTGWNIDIFTEKRFQELKEEEVAEEEATKIYKSIYKNYNDSIDDDKITKENSIDLLEDLDPEIIHKIKLKGVTEIPVLLEFTDEELMEVINLNDDEVKKVRLVLENVVSEVDDIEDDNEEGNPISELDFIPANIMEKLRANNIVYLEEIIDFDEHDFVNELHFTEQEAEMIMTLLQDELIIEEDDDEEDDD